MFQKEKDNSSTTSLLGHEKAGLHGVALVGDQGVIGYISQGESSDSDKWKTDLLVDLKCKCETCLCDHNLVKRKKVLHGAGSENEKVTSRYKVGSKILIFSTW